MLLKAYMYIRKWQAGLNLFLFLKKNHNVDNIVKIMTHELTDWLIN